MYILDDSISHLNKLMNISERLMENLNKLCELEVNNKKDSLEYKKYYDRYLLLKEVENKYYKDMDIDFELYNKLTGFFRFNGKKGGMDDFIYIIQGDYSKGVAVRIINKLTEEITSKYKDSYYDIPKWDYEGYEMLSMLHKGFDKNKFILIDKYFYKKLVYAYMYFLDSFGNNSLYKDSRENLIRGKYNLLFISSYAEEKFINNELEGIYYFDNGLLAYNTHTDKREITDTFDLFAINGLSNISKWYLNSGDYTIDEVLLECLLRAYIMQFSSLGYNFFNDMISHEKGKIKKKVLNIWDSSSEDRKNVSIVSFMNL